MEQRPSALYSNWIDDLPPCKHSGVGFQTNQWYRIGGGRGELTEYEDRSCHFNYPSDCYLYGVFDGHMGSKVANFALQKFPAELLLGQLTDDYQPVDVIDKLKDSFDIVEKGFLHLIDEALMEKFNLQEQMPKNMKESEAYDRFPNYVKRLQDLNVEISGGCAVVLALIHRDKLYVANVGDSRALLCRVNDHGDIGVTQLSTDHTINNNGELLRLSQIGLDIEKLQTSRMLHITRSIGDWAFKGGHKEFALLKPATEEPILSTPSIHGAERMNSSMAFLVLMTKGVYKTLEEATGTKQANIDIAHMVDVELEHQTTVESVSQAVVDKICRLHQERFSRSGGMECHRREDMTLLVRLFNARLGKPASKLGVSLQPSRLAATFSKNLHQKSDHLPRLIIPQTTGFQTPSTTSTPSSAGSSGTPTLNTPGSGSASPQGLMFSQPASVVHRPMRAPSPLTVTMRPVPPRHFAPLNISEASSVVYMEDSLLVTAPSSVPLQESLIEEEGRLASGSSRGSSGNRYPSSEDRTRVFNRPPDPLVLDGDGKCQPYVDFTDFVNGVNAAGGEAVVFANFLVKE